MKYYILAGVLAMTGVVLLAEGFSAPQIAVMEAPKSIIVKPTITASIAPLEALAVRAAVMPEILVLNKKNTISFSDVVTPITVAKFQSQLQAMSNKLPKNSEIIMVLYTPGGDVESGSLLIDSVKAIPQKVKTLTIFSASMGFHFVQALDERMILPSGTLMSHRAHGGMEGDFDGSFDTRLKAVKRKLDYLDSIAAARSKHTLSEYKELVRDEYWVGGVDSVDENMADRVVLARCDESMSGTHTNTLMTFFGPIDLIMSDCPLIVAPLDIKFGGDQSEILNSVNLLYTQPTDFVKQYIVTDKYKVLFK